STTLSPAVQRDTDLPDIGYEYDAIDYIMAGVTVTNSAVLLVTNGTVIAFDLSSASFGLKLADGGQIISQGTPTRMNRFIRLHHQHLPKPELVQQPLRAGQYRYLPLRAGDV